MHHGAGDGVPGRHRADVERRPGLPLEVDRLPGGRLAVAYAGAAGKQGPGRRDGVLRDLAVADEGQTLGHGGALLHVPTISCGAARPDPSRAAPRHPGPRVLGVPPGGRVGRAICPIRREVTT
ncbi:hypothetical protein SDC9_79862 [bioreactor metagenome]|uniref:Uncharacterized protein n=1 Tax=bioreactor metagenome TaxID=1076179 RepID=A0A644YXT7_9ZZZZ